MEYPLLQVDNSEEGKRFLVGYDAIVSFFVMNGLINDFRKFSAFEQQGKTLVAQFDDHLSKLFILLPNALSFYLRVTSFKEARYYYTSYSNIKNYRKRIFSRLFRCFKLFISNLFNKSKKEIKKDKTSLDVLKEDWVARLYGNPFYGGDSPGECDYLLLGVLKKYVQCRRIRLDLRKNEDKFNEWWERMQMLGERDSFYKNDTAGYSVNVLDEATEKPKVTAKVRMVSKVRI